MRRLGEKLHWEQFHPRFQTGSGEAEQSTRITPRFASLASGLAGLLLALLLSLSACGQSQPASSELSEKSYDLLFSRAEVVDGSGSPAYVADVAVLDGLVVAIGDLDTSLAQRLIDARGLTLAPGFIDVHSHAAPGLSTAELSTAIPLLAQGITTVVVNPDGGGPVDLVQQREKLEEHGLGVNVMQLVAHGSVRREVVGEEDVVPTAEQLESMNSLVRAGMEAGAWGLSSGTFYAPGSYSEPSEIALLASTVADFGGIYTSHIRDESDYSIGLRAAVQEVIDVARSAQLPAIVTHIKALGPNVWGQSRDVVAMIDAAREQGLEVYADQYPYSASATQLGAALVPRWAQAGGAEQFAARVADLDTSKRILEAMEDNLKRRGGAERIQFRRVPAAPELEGRRLSDVAEEREVDPVPLALELILAGEVGIVSFNMSEEDIRRFMIQPWTMTSSDGGLGPMNVGVPHPRNYGAFSRKLEEYVVRTKTLPLSQAIRSMTGLPAEVLGLRDRGLVREGMRADLVLFDLAQVRTGATFTEPHQLAAGMRTVVIDGQLAVDEGSATNTLAGRVLRKHRETE